MAIESLSQDMASIVTILNSVMISICQLLALLIIFLGVTRALMIYLGNVAFRQDAANGFQRSRLIMSYAFSLGLSFLIGASILRTMVSSQWDDFARLSAIIAVRTVLNLLLERSIRQGNTAQTARAELMETAEAKT
jgi:uncharacterized membrane protein